MEDGDLMWTYLCNVEHDSLGEGLFDEDVRSLRPLLQQDEFECAAAILYGMMEKYDSHVHAPSSFCTAVECLFRNLNEKVRQRDRGVVRRETRHLIPQPGLTHLTKVLRLAGQHWRIDEDIRPLSELVERKEWHKADELLHFVVLTHNDPYDTHASDNDMLWEAIYALRRFIKERALELCNND